MSKLTPAEGYMSAVAPIQCSDALFKRQKTAVDDSPFSSGLLVRFLCICSPLTPRKIYQGKLAHNSAPKQHARPPVREPLAVLGAWKRLSSTRLPVPNGQSKDRVRSRRRIIR
eukprot:scaffold7811_cov390-Prasinococcus_capsulatus_cf.AAC.2